LLEAGARIHSMRRFSQNRRGTAVYAAIALGCASIATRPAAAAEISVLTTAAPSEVEKVLAEKFTAASGHHVAFTIGTVRDTEDKLAGNEASDIVVLPSPALDHHMAQLTPGSRIELARVGIGIVVRDGAPRPDISTVDALRKTLLAARSIAHPDPQGGGFAGQQIARLFTRLGIAEALKPKVILAFAATGGVVQVANGEAEIGLFNISEILPVKGVTLVGPLVPELQSYITFSAALDLRSRASGPAASFLRALSAPQAREAWRSGGFELIGGPP
jgi:molybdate transport system substrate-binding protein